MRTLSLARTVLLALFVLSSAPAFAAGGGEGHHVAYTDDDDHDGTANWMDSDSGAYVLWNVGIHAINFAMFIGAAVYFGRRPVADALANRALSIRKELTESARLRDEAQQRNVELAARLDRIEGEIEALRVAAREQAANDEAKLIERAHAESERIQSAAERSIRDEIARARAALRKDAVELAVRMAETQLRDRVDARTQNALARDFLESLKQGGVNRV